MFSQKQKKILVVLSIVVGFVFGLPHLITPKFQEDKPYNILVPTNVPIYTVFDELTEYAPRMREVFEGKLIVRDSANLEHKTDPAIQPVLPAFLFGLLSRMSGSIDKVFILSDFLLPPIVFLISVMLVFSLTKRFILSLLGGLMQVIYNPWTFRPFYQALATFSLEPVKYFWQNNIAVLFFSRFETPQFTFILFVSTLLLLHRIWVNKKPNKKLALVTGITLGALFYSYFYYWVSIFGILGIMGMIVWYQKDKQRMKACIMAGIVALVISIPYWINLISFRQLPYALEVLTRYGYREGRFMSMNPFYIYHPLIAFLLLGYLKKPFRQRLFFIIIAFLVGVMMNNIQLITRVTVQPNHWSRMIVLPINYLMIVSIGGLWLEQKLRRLSKFGVIAGIFFLLGAGVFIQASAARNLAGAMTVKPDLLLAYKWLNRQPNSCVVGTPSVYNNMMLPAYTQCDSYLPYGLSTLASTEELNTRLYYISKIFQITPERFKYRLTGELAGRAGGVMNEEEIEEYMISTIYHYKFSYSSEEETAAYLDNVTEEYISYLAKEEKSEFKLDYLLVSNHERLAAEVSRFDLKNFEPVYKNDSVIIYQMKKTVLTL